MSGTSTSSTVEERLAMLESNKKFDATKEAIQEREVEFLAQLRMIKSELAKEQQKGGTSGSNSNSSNVEMERLKSENEQLKALVAKQSYRIKHLVDEMEKKQIYKQNQQQ